MYKEQNIAGIEIKPLVISWSWAWLHNPDDFMYETTRSHHRNKITIYNELFLQVLTLYKVVMTLELTSIFPLRYYPFGADLHMS